MGATNCPETPRQRMIGMMYLVLTAMLALNVSKDILNAFVVVDEALIITNDNFERKVENTYAQFLIASQNEPAKAGPFYKKALEVKELTKKMVTYLRTVRSELISKAEGKTMDEVKDFSVKNIDAKDNIDIPHNYFFVKENKAVELKSEIDKFREKLLTFVDPKSKVEFEKKIGLVTNGKYENAEGASQSWEEHNFGETILAASITMINKLIGEVKNAEFDMLTYLMSSIRANDYSFDNVSARVIPNSKLVFSGSEFEADIIVAAFDSKSTPEVYYKMGVDTATKDMVPSMTKVEGANGVVQLKIPATGMGEQKFAGLIKMRAPDGTDKYYSFKESYSVAKSSATVAAEKMNVLYAGIDNPISVSAPVPPEKIRIGGGGLAFRGSSGKYVCTPSAAMVGTEINVTVSAEVGGKTQSLGGQKFRVMRVPEPQIAIGSIRAGSYPASAIVNNPIVAKKTDGFAYDMIWKVSGFSYIIGSGKNKKTGTVPGNRFPGNVANEISNSEPGTTLIIHTVNVSATIDGRPVDIKVDSKSLGVAVTIK